jgi:hypothetical protein
METFKVEAVMDGNTFEISPKWQYEGVTGDLVEATGYFPPKSGKGGMAAEQKLSILIHNKKVELGTPQGIQRNRLICGVYFNGMNLADYFSDYRKQGGGEEEAEEQAEEQEEEDGFVGERQIIADAEEERDK